MVRRGSVVLTDKRFGIRELCLQKGLHHNRPPIKFDAQYDETDISKNFDIATLKIYNENCDCQIFSGFAFPFKPLVVSFALLSLVFVVLPRRCLSRLMYDLQTKKSIIFCIS